MTVVPLPDTPTLRVRFIWNEGAEGEGGVRLYFSYTGSAPSGANCNTLASDFETAWASHIAPLLGSNCVLNEVDVLDIATHTGASGTWNGSDAGGNSGPFLPWNCAMNVEWNIARRYRGGKPRMYLPPLVASGLADQRSWSSSAITSVNDGVDAFISECVGFDVGSVGTLGHISLSYYQSFHNVTNTSGRTRAVPLYRTTALSDPIIGHSAKVVVGSQRRRRTSTTP